MICALEDNTVLDFFDRKGERFKGELEAGDVCWFRGDLIHAGVANPESINHRIFAFVGTKSCPPDPSRTWKVSNPV